MPVDAPTNRLALLVQAKIVEAEIELRERVEREMADALKMSLADYVESTVNFKLDDWQLHLCRILESTATTSGRRILIHAPPQYGKTVIVSQRFPAWLMARKPLERIKVAMYNVSHATKHTKQIRALMEDPAYIAKFPDEKLRLPSVSSAEAFSTAQRLALNDGQPSIQALGLATGLVGTGPDTTIIDDPYSDPSEARSETINDSVWSFWTDSLKPRLASPANVIVMFHRYTENDLAGRLLATGEWELYRYAAVCDGDYECKDTKKLYPDPLGRTIGESLSPRFSAEFIAEKKAMMYTWLSQFQGRPTAKEGELFKVGMIQRVESAPSNLRRCRAWDLAATKGGGDFTSGVLLGMDDADNGTVYVLDVARGQWGPDEVIERMVETARRDPPGTLVRFPQDPGQAGKFQAGYIAGKLAGQFYKAAPVSGDKETRAFPFASHANAGKVRMLAGPWNEPFIEELRTFPKGVHDDQTDPAADSFNELANGAGQTSAPWEAA